MAAQLEKHSSRVVPTAPASSTHALQLISGPVQRRRTSQDEAKVANPCSSTSGDPSLEETAQITRRSLSLLSRSSLRLLSRCSSLESLASLGLSFHGSCSAVDSLIEAEFHCTSTLNGHGQHVLFSPHMHTLFIASSSASSAIAAGTARPTATREWSAIESKGFGCFIMKREGPPVRAMAVVGDLLFSSHEDVKLRVWTSRKSDKGSSRVNERLVQLATLPTVWDCVKRAVMPGAFVQVRRNQKKSLWIQHVDAISALAISHSQDLLYSASWDRSVKVWRLPDFKCMESFRAHDDAINALAISRNGQVLYTGSSDSKIKTWARSEGPKKYMKHSLVSTLAAHRSAVNALVISHDGSLLYSGACDKAIVVWETGPSMGTHLAGALRGHRHAVLCLAIVGTSLCSGSADKTIRLWQRVAGRLHTCLAVLEGHMAPIKSLSIASHSEECPSSEASDTLSTSCHFSLYSASLDQDVKVWSIKLTYTNAYDVDSTRALQPSLLQGGPHSCTS